MERKNVFMLGYDPQHAQHLQHIKDAQRYRLHPLLHAEDLVYREHYDVDAMLDEAREVLRSFSGPIDGIIHHWDFPVADIHAILCREFDLPGPSLEAVMKCSHKYWSRLEQRVAAPENTPDFCGVDPFDDDALESVSLPYPFWVKPVRGYGSALGFRVENAEDFKRAMDAAREGIRRLGEPANRILEYLKLPDEVAEVDGNCMIAEALIGGMEFAPEGYVFQGRCRVHGLIDDVPGRTPGSFLCHEYPSRAPKPVQERAVTVSCRVLEQIGFDQACFNIEFFWDQDEDRLWIVEINPRLSQSHSNLFEKVDGASNHQVAVHLALGEPPEFDHGSGPYRAAAKFYQRRNETSDAVVRRVPGARDLEALERLQPDTIVTIVAQEGARLSEQLDDDEYSYLLSELMIGADDHDQLVKRFEEAVAMLPFEFDAVEESVEEAVPEPSQG